MTLLNRREALLVGGERLLAFSLATFLLRTATADDRGVEEIAKWLESFYRLGERLGTGELSQAAWQAGIADLYDTAPLARLQAHIDFNRLADELTKTEQGEIFHTLKVGRKSVEKVVGAEPSRVMITKLAHIKKGKAVPPHGHSNMVSAFLHLSGDFHVRLYDKVEMRDETMLVRPSADFIGGAGRSSSVSDVKDNVHWLTANSDDCFLFTTKMIRLEEGKPFHGRININTKQARELCNGVLEAPLISAEEARRIY